MRIILFFILFFSYSLFAQSAWQKEADKRRLNERYEITKIDDNIVKLKHKMYGKEKYVNISDQNIDLAKPATGMQVFDLLNTDTNLYKSKYTYKEDILVSGLSGYPMVFGDFNNNNKLDIAGSYKLEQDLTIANCAIFELQNNSDFILQKIYADSDSVVNLLTDTDVDNDKLIELNFKKAGGRLLYNYESKNKLDYPDSLIFKYRMWEMCGAVGSETFCDMDFDGIEDIIYKGDDSLPPSGTKIFVAEYDITANNFVKRFSYRPEHWRVSGFSVGDFDSDGYKEFVTGSIDGDVYVFENSGNDSYDYIFNDTISTPNAYLTCATNDMDNNGKIEFFVGGSSFYQGTGGTKVYWFEADGNNSYIKKYNFFLRGTDVLGTTEMYSHDVNADNIDDLVFAFGGAVVILIWNQQGFFDLHYLDWLENWDQEIQSVDIYDLYGTGKPDLLVSLNDIERIPRLRSEIYLNNFMTGIYNNSPLLPEMKLYQNFPNPFNSSTTIKFHINKCIPVQLIIYSINGREVIRLIKNQIYSPGEHKITWKGTDKYGKEVSSGIYMYQLKTDSFIKTQKMIYIR